ncbi:MAG TPA: DHHA1 domain-containing protein, partial [Solirubrobacteraceae bacterium]
GRLHRADAGVELLLTEDPVRADAIAAELDAANADRRHVETRILFEAEAQVAALGERPAYVLAAEGWHPGVIGIVASRIAERHNRPAVLIALAGERGTGSGRSIPAFDLLAGLDACAGDLVRHGGHRAAAGCTIAADRVDAFRSAFEAHAATVLDPADLIPHERVDAVVGGGDVGMTLAEELARLAPYGIGNPRPSLLIPAATFSDPRPMGEGKHVRFTVEAGPARAAAVAFGRGTLPAGPGEPLDATFTLEVNRWKGREDARLVLRRATAPAAADITFTGRPEAFLGAALVELDAPLPGGAAEGPPSPARDVVDRRGASIAATVTALVWSGEPVLVVAACEERRARGLRGRLGGFALCSWAALVREPALADGFAHLVVLDPPSCAAEQQLLDGGQGGWTAHLAWGEAELRFTHDVLQHDHELRAGLAALYRALRDGAGAPLEDLLRGEAATAPTPARAGRLLRVLLELGLVELDRGAGTVAVPRAERTELEGSAAFRAYAARREEGLRWLTHASARAA